VPFSTDASKRSTFTPVMLMEIFFAGLCTGIGPLSNGSNSAALADHANASEKMIHFFICLIL
jgi:hypothetical protein